MNVPVICVGNLNLGGTGKTPTVVAIVQKLLDQGANPHILSRGYGGSLSGPVLVTASHTSGEVGDEPKLLSAFAPTWISRNRMLGAVAAQSSGAEIIVMDDGFQNPDVTKDISLVVVDAQKGFGNEHVFPSGPLREPIEAGLARADAVILIGSKKDREKTSAILPKWFTGPVLNAELVPLVTGMDWQGLRCIAFAGIGRPEKFFATLRGLGADVVKSVPLADHKPLSPSLLGRLQSEAKQAGAQLVTTEKDATRLPEIFRTEILTLPVRLKFDRPKGVERLLRSIKPDN